MVAPRWWDQTESDARASTPPSTTSSEPVMYADSSDSSHSAACACSIGIGDAAHRHVAVDGLAHRRQVLGRDRRPHQRRLGGARRERVDRGCRGRRTPPRGSAPATRRRPSTRSRRPCRPASRRSRAPTRCRRSRPAGRRRAGGRSPRGPSGTCRAGSCRGPRSHVATSSSWLGAAAVDAGAADGAARHAGLGHAAVDGGGERGRVGDVDGDLDRVDARAARILSSRADAVGVEVEQDQRVAAAAPRGRRWQRRCRIRRR